MSRWRRLVRSFYCRAGLLPHRFRFWARVRDDSETLIVERCIGQPWCRVVRSYPYHPIVAESLILEMERIATMPNPYRALFEAPRAGTAATAPPAPTDIPAGSTPQRDQLSESDIGEGDQSSFTWDGGPYGSLSLTGAPALTGSSTFTPTPFDDWRRSRSDSRRSM